MRHENETPTNHRRRLHAAIYRPYTRGLTMLVVVLAGLLAAIIVGPGRVVNWLIANLIPVAVVFGVIVGVLGLAGWVAVKLYDKYRQPW